MGRLSIKHLRYFDALAQRRHFGHAAEDCAITQPALSVQIKELEEIVGAPLVERAARRIHLTGLGEAFAERARDLLHRMDELEDIARAAGGPLVGRLRMGIIPTVAPYLLPAIYKAVSTRFPGLDLRPREAVTRKLIEDLAEARLDMAMLALPVSESFLAEMPLFEEEFVLVRAAADADKPVPGPDTLRTMRLLLLEEGHCFRDQALSFCNISPTVRGDLMEGSSLSTLVQMVGAGLGVTLIPDMAVEVETRNAPVSVARLAPAPPTRRIGMVWRRSNPLAAEYAQIAELVGEVGRAASQPADSASKAARRAPSIGTGRRVSRST